MLRSLLKKVTTKVVDTVLHQHTSKDGVSYVIDEKGTRRRRYPKVKGKAKVKRHKKARQALVLKDQWVYFERDGWTCVDGVWAKKS